MIPQLDSGKSWYSNFQYLPRLNQNNLRNKNIVKGLYFIDSPRQYKNGLEIPSNLKIDSQKDIKQIQNKEQQFNEIHTFRGFKSTTPKIMRNPAFKKQQTFFKNYDKYMLEVNDQMNVLISQQATLSKENKRDDQIIVKQINFENLMDVN